uniref:Uncharacterized protein n=1 Tax=Arundo donax TaxID=35708 RepID=A0A0A9FEU9_ARUDO
MHPRMCVCLDLGSRGCYSACTFWPATPPQPLIAESPAPSGDVCGHQRKSLAAHQHPCSSSLPTLKEPVLRHSGTLTTGTCHHPLPWF